MLVCRGYDLEQDDSGCDGCVQRIEIVCHWDADVYIKQLAVHRARTCVFIADHDGAAPCPTFGKDIILSARFQAIYPEIRVFEAFQILLQGSCVDSRDMED